jgi:hypothetical protein
MLRTRALAIVFPALVALQYVNEAAQGSLGFGLGVAAATDGLMFAIVLLSPLVPAMAQATQRELGLDRERHLDGLSTHRLAVSIALATITVVVAIVLVSLAIGAVLGVIDATLRESRPGAEAAAPSGRLVMEGIVATAAAAAALAGLGGVMGLLFRTRLAAVLAATVVAGTVFGLERLAVVYSSIDAVVDATPQGASLALMERAGSSGSVPSMVLPAAVLLGWVIVGAAIADRGLRRRTAVDRRGRPRSGHPGRALAVVGILALPIGFVGPVAMRDEVPWYLRPQWIGDQLADRASDDIVRMYVQAVADGDERKAGQLTIDRAGSRLLGPFRRQVVADREARMRTLETREEPPGTVVVDFAPGALAEQLKFCMTRRGGRWRVQSVSSAGVCG